MNSVIYEMALDFAEYAKFTAPGSTLGASTEFNVKSTGF